MILIAHRGNINGAFPSWENEPTYIDSAIQNRFQVEVDIWKVDKILYLGHDKPLYGVDFEWLDERRHHLWIHCKNVEALSFFNSTKFHYFWHENDTATLTSEGFIWAFPGKQPIANSIAVMPEIYADDISSAIGVCSDFVANYKK
jgi:hypothetical protein